MEHNEEEEKKIEEEKKTIATQNNNRQKQQNQGKHFAPWKCPEREQKKRKKKPNRGSNTKNGNSSFDIKCLGTVKTMKYKTENYMVRNVTSRWKYGENMYLL